MCRDICYVYRLSVCYFALLLSPSLVSRLEVSISMMVVRHNAAIADGPVSISSVLINLSVPGIGQRRKINQLAARSRERRIRAPWEG